MRSRAVRITLTLLTVAAIGSAAYFSWTVHSRRRADHRIAATFEQTRVAALRDAYELRSTQQAYVAAGQNETFWFEKVTELVESLRAATTALRSSTTSPAVLVGIDEALAGIEEFTQADRRARSYAEGGQKLLASDVIFSPALEAARRITTGLQNAGAALAETTQASDDEAMRQQAIAAGGAAVFAVLALLLLTPRAATEAKAPVAAAQEPSVAGGATLPMRGENKAPQRQQLPNRDTREAVRRKVTSAPPETAGARLPPSGPPPAAAQPEVELHRLAALCTDLARLSDTSMLPGILERAAGALDASGVVLWMVDQEGTTLVPIATHGYPPSVVSRMGALRVDGENATAAAFRTGLLQTVSASPKSNGAIAVPLLASAGCRGVMSAEVRNEAQKQPARLAAASILAAQLAALAGVPANESAQGRDSAAL
jgi:hypothetical protein